MPNLISNGRLYDVCAMNIECHLIVKQTCTHTRYVHTEREKWKRIPSNSLCYVRRCLFLTQFTTSILIDCHRNSATLNRFGFLFFPSHINICPLVRHPRYSISLIFVSLFRFTIIEFCYVLFALEITIWQQNEITVHFIRTLEASVMLQYIQHLPAIQ